MNRRGFLGKLVKAVAVAAVVPTALVTARGFSGKFYGYNGAGVNPWLADEVGKCAMPEYTSFRYGGRTFHMKKWTDDAFETYRVGKQDVDKYLKDFGWAMPKPDGTIEYKYFK